jgi:hypothetical protein
MRTLIRTLAATAALAALVLGTGASTALAAGDPSARASVASYDFGDSWCFDFGTQVDCTVTDGTLSVTTTPDGREIARIHFRETVTSFDPDGTQIGTFKTASFDRTVFADGGQDSTFSVSRYQGSGAETSCHGSYLLKIVDYAVQVEHINGPHCS